MREAEGDSDYRRGNMIPERGHEQKIYTGTPEVRKD